MTELKKAIEQYIIYCEKHRQLSHHSIRAYRIDMGQFLDYLDESHASVNNVLDVSKPILQSYIVRIKNKYAPKTCKRKIATLKAFLNHLEYEDVIEVNPMRKIRIEVKESQTIPKAMQLNEVEKLIKPLYQLRGRQRSNYSAFHNTRAIAILEILFTTGIRVGELCSLTLDSIDLENKFIRVQGKGNKERLVFLASQESIHALQTYIIIRSSKKSDCNELFVNWFSKKMTEDAVRNLIYRLAKEALPGKHITPHMFRHTFASLLIEQGVDIRFVQDFLGHSSISTTQIYLHLSTKAKRSILEEKHPRNRLIFAV